MRGGTLTGFPTSVSTAQVPRLHELLSDMASERDELRRKLQEQQLELASRIVSPRQAVMALLLGQPTSLEHFQSLEQKLALVDTAVAMHAGSALTKIVVFLARTLSSHVLHRHLASRPQAAHVRHARLLRTE